MNTDKTKLLICVHLWPMPFGSFLSMVTNTYVELHARSAFSFLEGACVPEDLAGACASLDMPAMALLDRNGVYGSPPVPMGPQKAGGRRHTHTERTSPQ